MNQAALLALALLAAGCAAEAGAAPSPVAPPYRSAAPMRWQQRCEQAWTVPQASEMAAARGNEGWELVAMYNGVLCFKRPMPGSAPEPGAPLPPQPPGFVPAVREPGF